MIKAIEFPSKVLGRTVPITVIEPTQLDIDGRCRTLFALHGSSGCHSDWVNNARLDDYVAGLPVVTILPSAGDSFYMQQPDGDYGKFVAEELVAFADSSYPTVTTGKARGILGLSMGGWGALLLALQYRGVFSSAASHSGAVIFNRMKDWDIPDKIFGEGDAGQARRDSHDLVTLAKQYLVPVEGGEKPRYSGPSIYFDCGVDDFLFVGNRSFADGLRAAAIPYEYHEYPGGHEWLYWDRHVRESVRWVAGELAIG